MPKVSEVLNEKTWIKHVWGSTATKMCLGHAAYFVATGEHSCVEKNVFDPDVWAAKTEQREQILKPWADVILRLFPERVHLVRSYDPLRFYKIVSLFNDSPDTTFDQIEKVIHEMEIRDS